MESSQQNTNTGVNFVNSKRTNEHEVISLCQTQQSFVLFASKLIDDDRNRKRFLCIICFNLSKLNLIAK